MVSGVPASVGATPGPWHAMIWTTTPWTLPANVAIAVHPDLDYAGVRYTDPATGRTVRTILAADLVAKVMALRQGHRVRRGRPVPGKELEHAEYRHPFVDRVSPIVLAGYVSVEDGTGLVHTAPGHGAEDYQTGRAYQLPILSPVDAVGPVHRRGPRVARRPAGLRGQPDDRRARSRSRATCSTSCRSSHSYPHCWRCKKPVIFRATEQWFIGVDHNDLRGRTLKAIDDVTLAPRLGPVADRGDGRRSGPTGASAASGPGACRSRPWAARPARPSCSRPRPSATSATSSAREGADAWFTRPVEELLPAGRGLPEVRRHVVPQGGGHPRRLVRVGLEPSRRAGRRTSSWAIPAFMYLEGSDQHRGWFQSSILTAVGTHRHAPRSRPC